MLFRLQNNVPDVYVQESRDFQLFCRLYDSAFNSVKYSIDSLQRASSTKECDSILLELLKTKLGLFSNVEVPEENLRCILSAFPVIMRYKGSRIAIDYILTLYSRMTHSSDAFATYDVSELKNSRLILTFTKKFRIDDLLFDLLRYVLPTGFIIEYKIVSAETLETTMFLGDTLTVIEDEVNNLSVIRSSEEITDIASELKSSVGITLISEKEE